MHLQHIRIFTYLDFCVIMLLSIDESHILKSLRGDVRLKKYFINFCVVVLLCVMLFPITVTAHSGKTDSSGGHRDSSTGEYHYHHGYSAHKHYDMDGDGIIDCPYDFDDKTNHSSSSSGNNNQSSSSSSNRGSVSFWDVVGKIFLMIPLSLITLYLLYMVVGILFAIIEAILESAFKIYVEKQKMEKIKNITFQVTFVIAVLIEFICLLSSL